MSEKNSRKEKQIKKTKPFNFPNFLIKSGVVLIISALALFIIVFYQVFVAQVKYYFFLMPTQSNQAKISNLAPTDLNFGLMIPKIGLNTGVRANASLEQSLSPSKDSQKLAFHLAGSVYPGQIGNLNIMVPFWKDPNSLLLGKLSPDDHIFFYYRGKTYDYQVTDKKIVSSFNSKIGYDSKKIAVIISGWPPGTNLRKLVIISELAKIF